MNNRVKPLMGAMILTALATLVSEQGLFIEPLFAKQPPNSAHTRAGAIFKYKDKDGNVHIGQSVPPENVKYGYTVIDRYGHVIEAVERALSEEEVSALEAAESKAAIEARDRKAQQDKDRLLLKTFSSSADAERARDRKLAALDVIIDITKGNILRLEVEYENQQRKAAQYERVGKTVPEEIFTELDRIQLLIDEAFDFVKVKEAEKVSVRADYELDINRLRELRGAKEGNEDNEAKEQEESRGARSH